MGNDRDKPGGDARPERSREGSEGSDTRRLILARRAKFVAAALASVAVTGAVEACGGGTEPVPSAEDGGPGETSSGTTGKPQPCLDVVGPQPCLSPPADPDAGNPQPCLRVAPDAGKNPQPCLSMPIGDASDK